MIEWDEHYDDIKVRQLRSINYDLYANSWHMFTKKRIKEVSRYCPEICRFKIAATYQGSPDGKRWSWTEPGSHSDLLKRGPPHPIHTVGQYG